MYASTAATLCRSRDVVCGESAATTTTPLPTSSSSSVATTAAAAGAASPHDAEGDCSRMNELVADMWDEVGEQMGVAVHASIRSLELSKFLLVSFAEAVSREAHMLAEHRRGDEMLPADIAQALRRSWSSNNSRLRHGGRSLIQSGGFKRRVLQLARGGRRVKK
eukprot:GHVS01091941.1.p1 GENE.GHVS01091941.1~~GHVS01091941.1.p1  ORF type:complete len:164 (+),score=49.66 GHVS01091941.1:318-809(+)